MRTIVPADLPGPAARASDPSAPLWLCGFEKAAYHLCGLVLPLKKHSRSPLERGTAADHSSQTDRPTHSARVSAAPMAVTSSWLRSAVAESEPRTPKPFIFTHFFHYTDMRSC